MVDGAEEAVAVAVVEAVPEVPRVPLPRASSPKPAAGEECGVAGTGTSCVDAHRPMAEEV